MNPLLCPTCGTKATCYTDFCAKSGLFKTCNCGNGHSWPFKFISMPIKAVQKEKVA